MKSWNEKSSMVSLKFKTKLSFKSLPPEGKAITSLQYPQRGNYIREEKPITISLEDLKIK